MNAAMPLDQPGNESTGLYYMDLLVEENRELPAEFPVDRGLVLHALMELLGEAVQDEATFARFANQIGMVEEPDTPLDNLPWRIGRLVFFAEETGQVDALLPPLVQTRPSRASEAGLIRECYARSRFRELMAGPPAEPEGLEGVRDLPPRDEPATRLVDLRLDTAVPSRVYVGRPFRMAVAVRLPASPVLDKSDLPEVESGDLLVEWPVDASAVRLRLDVDAPDCAVTPPANESFRIFAGRDGPVLYYLLTPQKRGDIAIVVTVYVEGAELETLGAAGLNTEAVEEALEPAGGVTRSEPVAGAVEVHVQSLSLSRLTDPRIVTALQPLRVLFTDLFAYDADLPLRLAQRALIDTTRIERSNVLADQWWLVLVAAHNSGGCDALVSEAVREIPEREADLRAALATYNTARVAVPAPAPGP